MSRAQRQHHAHAQQHASRTPHVRSSFIHRSSAAYILNTKEAIDQVARRSEVEKPRRQEETAGLMRDAGSSFLDFVRRILFRRQR
jgi:hypothetical protein